MGLEDVDKSDEYSRSGLGSQGVAGTSFGPIPANGALSHHQNDDLASCWKRWVSMSGSMPSLSREVQLSSSILATYSRVANLPFRRWTSVRRVRGIAFGFPQTPSPVQSGCVPVLRPAAAIVLSADPESAPRRAQPPDDKMVTQAPCERPI